LNLQVQRGSVYGFLGRNGAGKTTAIKILIGLIRNDSGEARVFGIPSNGAQSIEIRRRTGFVTEDKDLYPYMTVEEMIRFTRSFFPKWRGDLEKRYLELFELPRRRKTDQLSKGMRSKLMLLLAIARGAELLILDEPSDGLDPAVVEDVLRELMALAAAEGTTIFFSSHQLHEVEQIADNICIIDGGRAVVAGSLDDLKCQYQRVRIVFDRELAEPVRWVAGAEHVQQEGRTVSILANRNIDAVLAQAQSLPGASVERFPVTLKEIFLEHVRTH
jgi:ABC-2 type transport system ATP-binding protein